MPMTEVELCTNVKKSNLFPGFTLHEEVGMDMNGNSCDMVYHKDDEVYCIEAKLDFNFEVVAQAARWVKKATKSYIAIPYKKVTWKYGKSPKVDVCDALGIGIIIVDSVDACFMRPSFNPVQTHDFVWEQEFPNKAMRSMYRAHQWTTHVASTIQNNSALSATGEKENESDRSVHQKRVRSDERVD